jgi:hypothetical protein
VTAFGSAAIENGLTCFGLHSGPETVGAVTFYIAGLKSSFAHGLSLFSKDDSNGRDLFWPVFKTTG